jgi:hypothetical protein
MTDFHLSTPVAFIIFNRPDTTVRVFEAIRQAQPPKLLVVADGPRAEHPEDVEKCAAARAVVENTDWDCEVLRNYAESNMGCKQRVSSGLDWVFDTVEEAIILEDDCLPHPTFFRFCAELLNRYKSDTRVMHINGNLYGQNFQFSSGASYSFCLLPQVWGWASWRRAWDTFDKDMRKWPQFRDNGRLSDLLVSEYARARLCERWRDISQGKVDTWDFQWHFSVISNGGLVIAPRCNLISNIGFSNIATHTSNSKDSRANCKMYSMLFPLKHPEFILNNNHLTKFYVKKMMGKPSISHFARGIMLKLERLLNV